MTDLDELAAAFNGVKKKKLIELADIMLIIIILDFVAGNVALIYFIIQLFR